MRTAPNGASRTGNPACSSSVDERAAPPESAEFTVGGVDHARWFAPLWSDSLQNQQTCLRVHWALLQPDGRFQFQQIGSPAVV